MSEAPNVTIRVGKGLVEILRHLSTRKETSYSDLRGYLLGSGAYVSKQQVDKGLAMLSKKRMIEQKNEIFRITRDGRKMMDVMMQWTSDASR
jgi:hypothetical protein